MKVWCLSRDRENPETRISTQDVNTPREWLAHFCTQALSLPLAKHEML